jgi:hypothetical protein
MAMFLETRADNGTQVQVVYTSTDRSGNVGFATRNITLVDTEAPQTVLRGSVDMLVDFRRPGAVSPEVQFVDPGCDTTDDGSGNLTRFTCVFVASVSVRLSNGTLLRVNSTSNVNVSASVGTVYVLQYVAQDHAGNVAVVNRSVSVADLSPPNVFLLGGKSATDNTSSVELLFGLPFRDAGAWATDEVDGVLGAVSLNPTLSQVINSFRPGAYIVQCTVRDATGNVARVARNVTVAPLQPPETQFRLHIAFGNSPADIAALSIQLQSALSSLTTGVAFYLGLVNTSVVRRQETAPVGAVAEFGVRGGLSPNLWISGDRLAHAVTLAQLQIAFGASVTVVSFSATAAATSLASCSQSASSSPSVVVAGLAAGVVIFAVSFVVAVVVAMKMRHRLHRSVMTPAKFASMQHHTANGIVYLIPGAESDDDINIVQPKIPPATMFGASAGYENVWRPPGVAIDPATATIAALGYQNQQWISGATYSKLDAHESPALSQNHKSDSGESEYAAFVYTFAAAVASASPTSVPNSQTSSNSPIHVYDSIIKLDQVKSHQDRNRSCQVAVSLAARQALGHGKGAVLSAHRNENRHQGRCPVEIPMSKSRSRTMIHSVTMVPASPGKGCGDQRQQ